MKLSLRSARSEGSKHSNFWIASHNILNVMRNYRYILDSTNSEVTVETKIWPFWKINGWQKLSTLEFSVKTLNPTEFWKLNQKRYKKYKKFKNLNSGHLETIVTRWTKKIMTRNISKLICTVVDFVLCTHTLQPFFRLYYTKVKGQSKKCACLTQHKNQKKREISLTPLSAQAANKIKW